MDRAYIVANKEQELDVLKRFEQNGLFWMDGENPTKWLPSENVFSKYNFSFPYILIDDGSTTWCKMEELEDETIVYDGRKEGKMDKKYLVTQEFMDKLSKWRDTRFLKATTGSPLHYLSKDDLDNLNNDVKLWWYNTNNPMERNNRLIAIVSWLNGEDVFEVEKEPKFYVRVDVDGEEQSVAMWQNSDGESGIAFDVFMRNEPAYTETDADNLVAGLTALNARKVKVEE